MKQFFKSDKCRTIIMTLVPLCYCIIYCLIQGKSIFDVYLPASEWNDELFYYKQVESILSHGFPQGYFGFNESHALKLSFAAWSPVLVAPWVLWGAIFGWNYLSPILCNIVLMMIAAMIYAMLVKPTWKQVATFTILFVSFTPFARYMLSGMPEVICFSFLVVYYANIIRYVRSERLGNLLWAFALAGMLTLMRPYLLLFLLLPIYFAIRKYKAKGCTLSLLYSVIVLAGYALIKYYLGAEYFAPLYFTDWIKVYFEQGIVEGVSYTIKLLFWNGKSFWEMLVNGIKEGLAAGSFFAGYIGVMVLLFVQVLHDGWRVWRNRKCAKTSKVREKNGMLAIELHLVISFIGMLVALLLMYKLTEGSKHLLTFIATSVFVICLLDTKRYVKTGIISAWFIYLYMIMAVEPYDYQVPFVDAALEEQLSVWNTTFDTHIELSEEDAPNYSNDVIWVFNDVVPTSNGEKTAINTKWQLLYELPKGMGISCCMSDYVMENLERLESRYLVTVSGGQVDLMCAEMGYETIASDEDIICYQRY